MQNRIAEKVRPVLATLAAEDRLLVCCSRTHLDVEARSAALHLLEQPLDWDYVLETSIRHNVTPLFYYGLLQALPARELSVRVPGRVFAELQRLHRASRVRNERLYGVIAEISDTFEKAGVEVMGIKDVQLARQIYPGLGLRPMGDIDLLIHPADYDRAAASLNQLEFVAQPDPDIPFKLKYAWGHFFSRSVDNTWVDLQWNVVQREWDVYHEGNFDFEIERLWRGAQWIPLTHGALRVPRPEDMLFHLCQHLEGHAYSELILFCDIAELLRHYDDRLDWGYIAGLAEKYRSQGTLYYILYLVERLFQAPLPPGLLAGLAPTYFQGNLFFPLYDSLNTLHVTLDEIHLVANPSPHVLRQFERVARHNAVGAMQAFRALDDLASLFLQAGGTFALYDGIPAERTWPDTALPAFDDLHCLILERDLPLMRQALADSGFLVESDHGAELYVKQWECASADPVLERPTHMAFNVSIETSPASALARERREPSARDTALKSLGARLVGYQGDPARIVLPLKILALSPEDIALSLTCRLGRAANRLFSLCSPLEFLRRYAGPLDWERMVCSAERYGVAPAVRQGMAVLASFTDDKRLSVSSSAERPHIFQAARFSASYGRYGAFRYLYFYLFSLLSSEDSKEGVRLLFRAPLRKIVTHGLNSLRRKKPTARDFAYWIES